eukprot:CAMPEP_0174238990 /NCGR_PEP_ID=MMETSP0417-20130205/13149_1 /TAXON_ID=242541 /ORGANISM="Mayorella sp, Strain BSH-02190019" /LENGTH=726 /DNA_ID=CAMNT_0015317885 /DNA_START=1 /DNA_END=2181 /DNA_ORIENTATION=+
MGTAASKESEFYDGSEPSSDDEADALFAAQFTIPAGSRGVSTPSSTSAHSRGGSSRRELSSPRSSPTTTGGTLLATPPSSSSSYSQHHARTTLHRSSSSPPSPRRKSASSSPSSTASSSSSSSSSSFSSASSASSNRRSLSFANFSPFASLASFTSSSSSSSIPTFSASGRASSSATSFSLLEEATNRTTNEIDEVQLLEAHTDIVRSLLRLDNSRILSAGDDGRLAVWNFQTGACLQQLPDAHRLPITCLLLLSKHLVVSGSADRTVKLWDLQSMECVHTLKGHSSGVRCLVRGSNETFYSGANDKLICIWSSSGELQGSIERQEDEILHCLLKIPGEKLITGSNSSLILVYDIKSRSYEKLLSFHRESVRCLQNVPGSRFASASLDGTIVLWSAQTLTPERVLHNPDKIRDEKKVYICSVHHLLSLGNQHIAAAIGNGFKIYNLDTGTCVMECPRAHDSPVMALLSLYGGKRILSCGNDSMIKIWGSKQRAFASFLASSPHDVKAEPVCLGTLNGHSDAVNSMVALTSDSFASCSSDGLVALWKESRVEEERRSDIAMAFLMQEAATVPCTTHSDTDPDESPSTPPSKLNAARTQRIQLADLEASLHEKEVIVCVDEKLKPDAGLPTRGKRRSVRANAHDGGGLLVVQLGEGVSPVEFEYFPQAECDHDSHQSVPEYIWDHVQLLGKEKAYSLENVADHLKGEGHSNRIVKAVQHYITHHRSTA